jgi:cyclophilin family peptidyl-prolyl cis-trans isomerase
MLHRLLAALAALAFGAFAQAALAANPQVEFDTTAGKIRIELYPEAAPKTVANFLDYVKAKHYDGTQFHRVIDGFMIQGGGFAGDFSEKPTRPPVVNEAEMASKAGVVNAVGTISMARTSDPHSATAQFFINVADNSRLNYRSPDPQGIGYTAFGKVVAGMDVVTRIAKTPKGGGKPVPPGARLDPRDVPTESVIINRAFVVEGK